MASVYHLCYDASDIKQTIVEKYDEYSALDKHLYFSAVAIQKTWRGYVVRKMIKDWNEKATLIQRYVRGWFVRLRMPEILKNYCMKMCMDDYNKKATKIQALWRGYFVRKKVSLKSRLEERKQIEQLSTNMQDYIRNIFEKNKRFNETYPDLKQILTVLFNRHHLIRTKVQEGVLSIHGSNELSHIEELLKSFPLKDYMEQLKASSQTSVKHHNRIKQNKFDLNTRIKPKPYKPLLLTRD